MRNDSPNGSSARQVCVLIVDDDKDCRRMLTICLEDIGCEVLAAATAEQALAAAATHPPDLALVDLNLGRHASGLELVPKLLVLRPDLRIIMITGTAKVGDVVEAVKRGAFDFLPKPFKPDQIRQLVAKLADDAPHPATLDADLPEFGGNYTLEQIERRHILALLARNDKLDEVAHTLGIDVSTLWRKRKKYEGT
jgi:two-component system response regulator RegA